MTREEIIMLEMEGYNYILKEANRKPKKKRRFVLVRCLYRIINLFKKHD